MALQRVAERRQLGGRWGWEKWEKRGKGEARFELGSRRTSGLNPSICPAANTITSTSNRRRKYGIAGFLTLERGTNLVETRLRYVTTELLSSYFSPLFFLLYFLFFFFLFLIETFFSLLSNDSYGRSRSN